MQQDDTAGKTDLDARGAVGIPPVPQVRGSVDIRARVADTDLMGVVYNSVYLVWFEIGRTELMRERGISYAEVEARGYSLPVTEAYFKVRQPARYDEVVRIETWIERFRSRNLTFAYALLRGDELLVTGWTTHMAVKHSERRSVPLPEWLRDGVRPEAGPP